MSRVINIDADTDWAIVADLAAQTLQRGGVILYPTDTTYALGANALNAEAVDRVFQLKGRDYTKPIHVVVQNLDTASAYVVVDDLARSIADQFLPGALTLVLAQKPETTIPPLLVAGMDTLGIRIPDHPVCKHLSVAVDFPITTTSANLSGMPNTYDVASVREQLGADFERIDLVLDAGTSGGGVSTVLGFEDGELKLFREGAVPFSHITSWLER